MQGLYCLFYNLANGLTFGSSGATNILISRSGVGIIPMKDIKKLLMVVTAMALITSTSFAGTLTGDDSNNANPIDITGSTAGTISLAGDATVSATGGDAVVTSTDQAVDIDGATGVTVDAAAGDVDINAAAGDINLTGSNLTWNGTAVATSANVSALRGEMRSQDARLSRGIAMVAAMVTPVIEEGDTQAVRVTSSAFAGDYGMAFGYARRLDDGVQLSMDAATTTDIDEVVGRVSLNYSW